MTLVASTGIAIVAFASTNIDDLFALVAFFTVPGYAAKPQARRKIGH